MALLVGFATVDITPTGMRQTIYHQAGQADVAVPLLDPLYARATAFRVGDVTAVLVTADVLCITTPVRDRVIASLGDRAPSMIALCATHTHTAPSIVAFREREPTPPAYFDQLTAALVQVIDDAVADLTPARVGFATADIDANLNRREIGRLAQINDIDAPRGLVDPRAAGLRIERDDGCIGWLINYAAHPLTMTDVRPAISADFPGALVDRLLERPNVTHAQFLQGCAGNLNPKVHGGTTEAQLAADRIAAVTADVHAISINELAVAQQSLLLSPGQHPVTIQAMRLGDIRIVLLPGEVFAETGLAIREHCDRVITVAYANHDEIGYIPTDRAIDEGGYEAVESAKYYQLGPWAKGTSDRFADAAVCAIEAC